MIRIKIINLYILSPNQRVENVRKGRENQKYDKTFYASSELRETELIYRGADQPAGCEKSGSWSTNYKTTDY